LILIRATDQFGIDIRHIYKSILTTFWLISIEAKQLEFSLTCFPYKKIILTF